MKTFKIAYFCLPAFGHIDWGGTLETLQILKAKGHEVSVATGPTLENYVSSFGLSFVNIDMRKIVAVQKDEPLQKALDRHQYDNFFNFEDTHKAFNLAREIYSKRGLDVVVSDVFCKPAQILSACMNVPRVTIDPQIPHSLIPSEMISAITKASEVYRSQIKDFLEREYLPDINLDFIVPSNTLNISFSTPEFDGSLASKATYVGASRLKINKEFIIPLYHPSGKKVYYSSGTLFWTPEQINAVLSLAKKRDINLFVGGARILPKIDASQNVKTFPFANDSEIFPYMDAIISQGGAGTSTKAIRSGTPLVVVPLIFANYAMAMKVERYGNGIGVLPEDFEYSRLEAALDSVLQNSNFLNSARHLQDSFSKAGGSEKAADIIENILK